MNNRYQTFQMDGQEYELLTVCIGEGSLSHQRVGIFRQVGFSQIYAMPIAELQSFFKSLLISNSQLEAHLNLYKRRFIGRTDVYAHRYFNKRHGKYFYSPVVPFKDNRPLLDHWIALTDEALREHLSGKEFLGFYPMFPDNTTKYLVLDVDGHHEGNHWKAITNSIHTVCDQHRIPTLIELSQSGNGCHIWIFFSERIDASKARQLGDKLLKEAMANTPEISFSAFDRLFPSQDIIQKDKLGNLIAGPLQGTRRRSGKSVFVDRNFRPLPDQWQALQSTSPLSESAIDKSLSSFTLQNDFRLFDSHPFQPNLLDQPSIINQPVRIVRSSVLILKKAQFTSKQLLQIKWLASFPNPEFYERQRQRMPIYNTPRIINLFKENSTYLTVPRGLENQLKNLIPHTTWIDKTSVGHKIHATFTGKLTSEQAKALNAIVTHRDGILSARTGFGKTVIAAKIIATIGVSTLILVHDKGLAKQWGERLHQFLEISDDPFITEFTKTGRKRRKDQIGKFYGSTHNRSGIIDIATIQSFKDNDQTTKILNEYGLVISDEVHHDAAFTFEQIIKQIRSKYLYGLTATPFRRDGQEPIISMHFGPIRYQTAPIEEHSLANVSRIVIPRFTTFGMGQIKFTDLSITENYEALINDSDRNHAIIRDVVRNLAEGRHILLLTNRVEHIQKLKALLKSHHSVYTIYGEQPGSENAEATAAVNKCKGPYILLATGKFAGEGLDIGTIDTLILAMPHSWKGNSIQYLGRTQRNLDNKTEIRVYDYVDMFVPMLASMYRKRQKTYKSQFFKITSDKYSQQSGITMFEGKYQDQIQSTIANSQKVLICTNSVNQFLTQRLIAGLPIECHILIMTHRSNANAVLPVDNRNIDLNFYDQNLPNCLIIDDNELWLSSDPGFRNNTGITIRIRQKELVTQFAKMLTGTSDRLV